MGAVRKKLRRKEGQRQYRRLFAIVVEGKTEQNYFQSFARTGIQVVVRQGKHSDPESVLNEAEELLEKLRQQGTLKSDDQAWVVVDRDQWSEKSLENLFIWARQHRGRGVGLSIPQFEYWLLLHYEDGQKVNSGKDTMARLKVHAPTYTKGKQLNLSNVQIKAAISRAKQHLIQSPRSLEECCSALHSPAVTSVHFLVEKLLQR